MNYIFGLAMFLTLVSSPILTQTREGESQLSSAEQELINLEREKDQAYERGDKAALARIYADDYIAIAANGNNTTKKEVLGIFLVRPNIYETHRSEDISVRVFGDTAIVTGRQKRKFYKDIKLGGEDALRYTNFYVKQQGAWKIVAAQFTWIKK
jgi:ketosteroid isomerase-like protein